MLEGRDGQAGVGQVGGMAEAGRSRVKVRGLPGTTLQRPETQVKSFKPENRVNPTCALLWVTVRIRLSNVLPFASF